VGGVGRVEELKAGRQRARAAPEPEARSESQTDPPPVDSTRGKARRGRINPMR
jgi:hypothetical protein